MSFAERQKTAQLERDVADLKARVAALEQVARQVSDEPFAVPARPRKAAG